MYFSINFMEIYLDCNLIESVQRLETFRFGAVRWASIFADRPPCALKHMKSIKIYNILNADLCEAFGAWTIRCWKGTGWVAALGVGGWAASKERGCADPTDFLQDRPQGPRTTQHFSIFYAQLFLFWVNVCKKYDAAPCGCCGCPCRRTGNGQLPPPSPIHSCPIKYHKNHMKF